MKKQLIQRVGAVCTSAVMSIGSLLAVSGAAPLNVSAGDNDNYAKLLQYSLYFYDANMCGDTVKSDCALNWRGNCHTGDDVVGGYHDAGDHVMFGLPQGYAASTIGWSYYEYKDIYAKLGLSDHFKKISKHFTDFFKKSTQMNGGNVSRFLYQKGEGGPDHAYWGAPEQQGDRGKMYWVNSGASDIAAEYAAALAIDYINFGDKESLDYAKALYSFSCQGNQVATDGTGGFYESESCKDDQAWAAAWLYMATKEGKYLDDAKAKNTQYLGWAHAWGNVDLGAACIIAEATNDWTKVNGYLGGKCTGSNYLCMDGWGSARYNCCMQFVSLVASKHSNADYSGWAKGQMDIILGANGGQNYVVGWNDKSPKYCHHRAASGVSDCHDGAPNKNVLVGALVGGPNASGYYADKRDEYETNEVAVDYQAGLVGAAAALYAKYGTGSTVTSIPGVGNVNVTPTQPEETQPPQQTTEPQQTQPPQQTTQPQQTQPPQQTTAQPSSSSDGVYELKVGKEYDYNTMSDKMIGFKYEDFGLKPGDPKLTKVEVDISANGPIKTWQGAFGSSTTVEADEYWTMTEQMEQSIPGNSGTLTWNVPAATADIIQYGYNGEIKVGFWWIDNPNFKIDAVRLYTAGGATQPAQTTTKAPETTKAPQTTTTTVTTPAPQQQTTTTTTTTTTSQPEKVEASKWGDADNNGKVDVSDAVLIARIAAEDQKATISAVGRANADVTHDGNLTADDSVKVLKFVAKLIAEADLAR